MTDENDPGGDASKLGDLQYNVYAARCPTRQALDVIADKWTALVVGLLAERPHRFGELRRAIEGISQKVLTQSHIEEILAARKRALPEALRE